jgi:hypothetical protein
MYKKSKFASPAESDLAVKCVAAAESSIIHGISQ